MTTRGLQTKTMSDAKGSSDTADVPLVFSGDAPIESRDEDILFRRDYAQHVARATAGWKQPRSLTVGLYGPWGSGKSSILNMVVEELDAGRKETGANVVRFDPWEWSSQDMLFRAFFTVVGETLSDSCGKELGNLWSDYGDRLAVHEAVLQPLKVFTPIAAAIGPIMALIGGARRSASNRASHTERAGKSPLLTVRQQLREALLKLPGNLVIIIDDLDRLTPPQMVCMIQLIKANAAFPRVVFLVAFDRDTVANGLREALQVDGEAYLEKVIQVPLTIPAADPESLRDFLRDRMRSLLMAQEVEHEFEWDRWDAMWEDALVHCFPTLRRINRFLDSYVFRVGMMTSEGCSEVDLVDLAALEALQQIESHVYTALATESDFFCSGALSHMALTGERDSLNAFLDRTLTAPAHRAAVESLLAHLFPVVHAIDKRPGSDRIMELVADRRKRIGNRRFFDVYFRCIGPGIVRQVELRRLIELEGRQDVSEALRKLWEQGRLDHVMSRLDRLLVWKRDERDLEWIVPMMDLAEEIQLQPDHPWPDECRLRCAVRDWVWEIGHAEQLSLWLHALQETKALFVPARLICKALRHVEGPQALEKHELPAGAPFVQQSMTDAPEHLRPSIELLVERIEETRSTGRLHPAAGIDDVLRLWFTWGATEPLARWLRLCLRNEERSRVLISYMKQQLPPLVAKLDEAAADTAPTPPLRDLLRSRLEAAGTERCAGEALPIAEMLAALDES